MSVRRAQEMSLRLDRPEIRRLAWAFGLSLAVHLFCFGGYELGKKFGIWQDLHWPSWFHKAKPPAAAPAPPQIVEPEIPLMFVDVDPNAASAEAPKNAKFFSAHNSQAANPNADANTDAPKIEGTQTEIAKAEDVPRVEKLQPTLPPAAQEQPPEQPKPQPPAGDLTMTKPDVNLRPEPGADQHSRPHTIKEAMMQHRNQLVGPKSKQEGGVQRILPNVGFDAKGTPFGEYTQHFVEAVSQHWYDLLDNYHYAYDQNGKVTLQFRLNYDGRITEMTVVNSSVSETLSLLCQKAVLDPAPFEKWSTDIRLMFGDSRTIQFTFLY